MGNYEKIQLDGHVIRRIIIAVYCVAVVACVAVVMFHYYIPSKNNLEALGSVCMDIICLIVLIILLVSLLIDNYGLYKTTKLFALMVLGTTWSLFLDFLNWAFDGALNWGDITHWFTIGSLCMGAVLCGIFCLYLSTYMEEMHRLSKMRKSGIVCASLNAVSFAVAFVLAITHTAFDFVDGHYHVGALYDAVTAIPMLTLLYLTIYIIRYTKKVGTHDVFAAIGYIFFMLTGVVIEATYNIGTTYVSVAIADIFIFVMLQNEVIAQEKRNALKWMKKSNTDVLTGFLNRYAYESDIRKFENEDRAEDLVYVSADVNGLKTVNDTLGHSAGDELLVGAAKCLEECFGAHGKLYRIGGDEFVAIINTDDETLEKIKKDIMETTQNWSGELVKSLTISCGYVTKEETRKMTVKQMAVIADRRMYEAKAKYYKNVGVDRRKI